jgi:hypothetical protein
MAPEDAPEHLDAGDLEMLNELERIFWAYVAKNYPSIRSKDIKIITASLLFSLVVFNSNPSLIIILTIFFRVFMSRKRDQDT